MPDLLFEPSRAPNGKTSKPFSSLLPHQPSAVNLLMRFYDVQGGRIIVDGIDIRELRRGKSFWPAKR
jgi:ABC-type transport system involved in Fe-S cluster assembly fused permease/ATPase subunit